MISNPFASLWTKINSKWVKDFNVKPKALKFLEKKIQGTIHDKGVENDFLNRTPFSDKLELTTVKWGLMKPTNLCREKWTINQLRMKHTEGKNICYISNSGLISEYTYIRKKELKIAQNEGPWIWEREKGFAWEGLEGEKKWARNEIIIL